MLLVNGPGADVATFQKNMWTCNWELNLDFVYSSGSSGRVGTGERNIKSMWPPSEAIFMTNFYRAGGGGGAWPPWPSWIRH